MNKYLYAIILAAVIGAVFGILKALFKDIFDTEDMNDFLTPSSSSWLCLRCRSQAIDLPPLISPRMKHHAFTAVRS